MLPDLYYCIAAYNEEENIGICLESLAEQNIRANIETIVCLNGCEDNTEEEVFRARKRHSNLNIQVIGSRKGLPFAQNAIVRSARNREVPMFFIDADVSADAKCVSTLYSEMNQLEQLIVAGAWPVPYKPKEMTAWQRILFDVLHARALFPESEVSVHDVSKFKPYAQTHPQPTVSPEFEVRSKIYFHGRAFMIRNADFFDMPEDENLVDDTFLPNMIHTRHGPGTIRTRYDALVYYKPYLSLRTHFRTYRRIYLDIHSLDRRFREFDYTRSMEQTKLDWGVICSRGPRVLVHFLAYSLLVNAEHACYAILPEKTVSDMWTYKTK